MKTFAVVFLLSSFLLPRSASSQDGSLVQPSSLATIFVQEASPGAQVSLFGLGGRFAGDLDGDGYPDAVVTEIEWLEGSLPGDQATIFWGSASGLSDASTTPVPAVGAAGCSIFDLDLDGYPDLVIGNQTDGEDYEGDSQIHWGSASGIDPESWTALPTRGVYAVVTHPLEDGY